MPNRLTIKAVPILILLAPALAILAGRLATYSDLAARYPREAGILYLWLCADALSLVLSHPNVVLQLSRPLRYSGLLGRTRMVERVAFWLDEPAPFLAALNAKL